MFCVCVLQTVAVVLWCALWTICKDFVLCSEGKDHFVLWVVDVVVTGNGCRWKQNYHPMIVDENYDYYRQCWQCLHQRREQKHLLDGEVITNLFFSKSKGNSSGYKEFPGRVAELGSLSSGAKMAMKIFVKRVFTIFASNASFLRVIANLQN